MFRLILVVFLALAACDDETAANDTTEESISLPRASKEAPAYTAPARFERTGREVMPLENIVAELEPHWRDVGSCEQVAYRRDLREQTYEYRLLYSFSRSAGQIFNLACEMEQHGYYVSHVARVQKEIWSDYNKRFEPRLYTFFRIRSADGSADFATYLTSGFHSNGNVNLDGCNREEKWCYFLYRPNTVINMENGLFTRFKIERRNRSEFYEDSGPVALLLGKDMPEVAAFVSGESDAIPLTLARRALVREVQRQYPEGRREALDLYGYVRPSQSGIVIEDVGSNLGLSGTDATYVVRLTEKPDCEETENANVRQCRLKVETSFSAYNRATGSRHTKIAQIANVAASGSQKADIEALFVKDENGWRLVVTDLIARFMSGVDRRNDWVVRTSDGRTLKGAPAVSCIANPNLC